MRHLAFSLGSGTGGVELVLFAPALRGYSDGDPVGVWRDLSSKSNNATAGGSFRPTYHTATQGGQPALLFDGINDYLACGSGLSLSSCTILVVAKSATTTGLDKDAFYFGNANVYNPNFNWVGVGKNYSNLKWVSGNYNNPSDGSVVSTTAFATDSIILSGITNDAGTNRLFLNGEADGTAPSVAVDISASARPTIGRRGPETIELGSWDGHIFSIVVSATAMPPALRQRIQQSSGYTFRIPTH